MTEPKWFVARGGEALGPYTVVELARMAATGKLARTDQVHPEGGTAWVAAATVPGAFPAPDGFVPCAKCNGRVSDVALACPHCGERQPRQELVDGTCDGGRCERCGTFNLLNTSGRMLQFPTRPTSVCRGCGVPLAEAYPCARGLAELERVHAHWLEVAPFWGWVAAVLAFAVQRLAFTDPGPIVVGAFFGCLAYSGSCSLTRRIWRWRAESHSAALLRPLFARNPEAWERIAYGTTEVLRNRPVREWSADGSFLTHSRPEPTAPAPAPAGWGQFLRGGATGAVVAVVLLVGGAILYFSELSQYELGRKAGVAHVRELSAKGPLVRAGMTVANVLDLIPSDPKATPDWNAGFRIGVKEELERMYPEPKRR